MDHGRVTTGSDEQYEVYTENPGEGSIIQTPEAGGYLKCAASSRFPDDKNDG